MSRRPPEMPEILRAHRGDESARSSPEAGRGRSSGAVDMGKAWTIAMTPVYGMIGMAAIGWGIDALAGTFPVWILIGAGLGLIGGGYRFVKESLAMNRQAGRATGPAGRPAAGSRENRKNG